MKDFMRRAGWAMMALLLLVTGLGAGIFAIYQGNQTKKDNAAATAKAQDQTKKLAGTALPGYTPTPKIAKLQYIDGKVGDGKVVKATSTVTLVYTGALAKTGTIFESSLDLPNPTATFSLSGVIPGFAKGLIGMKVNGQRRLLIPAVDGYGARSPSPSIPANSDLVFDITLTAVK